MTPPPCRLPIFSVGQKYEITFRPNQLVTLYGAIALNTCDPDCIFRIIAEYCDGPCDRLSSDLPSYQSEYHPVLDENPEHQICTYRFALSKAPECYLFYPETIFSSGLLPSQAQEQGTNVFHIFKQLFNYAESCVEANEEDINRRIEQQLEQREWEQRAEWE